MSANPVTLDSVLWERRSTNIKTACFAPLSYFERVLSMGLPTAIGCFSLIMVETLGAYPHPRPDTQITPTRFAETLGVTVETVHDSLGALVVMEMVRVRQDLSGAKYYSIRAEYIQEARAAGREKIRGRCSECNAVGLFSTEFIPLPHSALRKLAGCVKPAVFICTMVVARYTLKWNKESRCIDVEPHELNLEDFCRLTGLKKREITSALTEACQLGLIERQLSGGRPSLFRAMPENFGGLKVRPIRQVSQPTFKEKAKQEPSEPSENPNKQEKTHAFESRPYFYGRCSNCQHFVDILPVTEDEFAEAQPKPPAQMEKRPPRAGPIPPKKSPGLEKRQKSRQAVVNLANLFEAMEKKLG